MDLQIRNKVISYDLLGKTMEEVLEFMGRTPNQKNKSLWCYKINICWLKSTLVYIEFEDNIVCHIRARETYFWCIKMDN